MDLQFVSPILVTVGKEVKPSKVNQDRLHGELALPLRETGQLGWIDLTVRLTKPLFPEPGQYYTFPFRWSTQGRLTLDVKAISGGSSG